MPYRPGTDPHENAAGFAAMAHQNAAVLQAQAHERAALIQGAIQNYTDRQRHLIDLAGHQEAAAARQSGEKERAAALAWAKSPEAVWNNMLASGVLKDVPLEQLEARKNAFFKSAKTQP